jgi:hypothetical protein
LPIRAEHQTILGHALAGPTFDIGQKMAAKVLRQRPSARLLFVCRRRRSPFNEAKKIVERRKSEKITKRELAFELLVNADQ